MVHNTDQIFLNLIIWSGILLNTFNKYVSYQHFISVPNAFRFMLSTFLTLVYLQKKGFLQTKTEFTFFGKKDKF